MMENKKQLVIVPPLSEALQKLHEVLLTIAAEENVEISIIDDTRELNQFTGSAGQSLLMFANAKRCALFLQENRFALARVHSKVLLLTPKEIPAKTLVKFTKLGLTESILETSPPKTLLYKVKLLLRSIKSTYVSQQDEKDQVVKSMLDLNTASAIKREAITEIDSEKENTPSSQEEKKNKKTDDGLEIIDYSENKPKKGYQEAAIETNWKTRKKMTTELFEGADPNSKVDAEDFSNIDIYYRGKKKTSEVTDIQLESSGKPAKNAQIDNQEEERPFAVKQMNETVLDLHKEKTQDPEAAYSKDEAGHLTLNESSETIIQFDKQKNEQNTYEAQEERASARKKEIDELEALFEAARAKQAKERQAEDLGGYIKGSLDTHKLKLDEVQEEEKKVKNAEYDNSDNDEKKRSNHEFTALGPAAKKEKKVLEENIDLSNKKSRPYAEEDDAGTMASGDDGETDKISTLMVGEIGKTKNELFSDHDASDFMKTKKGQAKEESDYSMEKSLPEKNLFGESDTDPSSAEQTDVYETENDRSTKRKKSIDINLDMSRSATERDSESESASEKNSENSELLSSLKFAEDNLGIKKSLLTEQEKETIALKKSRDIDLQLTTEKNIKSEGSKADHIDTYYRSGENKKQDFSWDILPEKDDVNISLNLKKSRNEQGLNVEHSRRDLGEEVIDYRRMREEFDSMARNGGYGSESERIRKAQGLVDSEDEGTFKVVEINARGFEFSVDIINLIYQKDTKPQEFYKKIAEEFISHYHGYPVFYSYKTSDKNHTEAFDGFLQTDSLLVSEELKSWWQELKADKDKFNFYFEKSMTTWLCREIPDSKKSKDFWEDVELPSWAAQELKNKKVELILPYFDGVDKMGLAIIFFPDGIRPELENSMLVTLEMARTILLETIQRTLSVSKDNKFSPEVESPNDGKDNKILNMFSGLFGKNKAS